MTKLIQFKNNKDETLRGFLNTAESNRGVLFIHGYERTTAEYKFKNMVDSLDDKINMFRFDFSGCGISDGEFGNITSKKYAEEIKLAVKVFKNNVPELEKITVVAHSFAPCAVLEFLQNEANTNIDKMVFLGPALNQKVLQRFSFAKSKYRLKQNEITVENYGDYIVEKDFQDYITIPKRLSKAHYVKKEYFLENERMDYQELLLTCGVDFKNILIVHGDYDRSVPIESNGGIPDTVMVLRVKKGDHNLERLNMVEQYLPETIKFILKK